MASMARLDPDPSVRIIRSGGYLNKQLIAICQSEGLNKVGVKAELQQRIIEKIQSYAAKNEVAKFNRLKHNIENPNAIQTGQQYAAMAGPANANSYLNAVNNHQNLNSGINGFRGFGGQRLEFKPSPFYTFEQQLGETRHCEVMQHHRHTISISLRACDHPALARVQREPALKVLVFCSGEQFGRQDVAFPHQSEIKVNGGEIKANLRGLKNKPGSTRPVDITKELRLNPQTYSNNVELTYALTTKKFYFLIYVVRSVPVADLVRKLEAGKRITEKSVLDEMANKARDTDIMATASVLSLKCPLSTLRIDLPVRSISCRHNQCFDATSYLQLQEQGPTWLCPICNNSAPFESLAIDEYVKDILKKTSKAMDQVTVQPNGKWDINAQKTASASRPSGFSDDSDDDLIEITKTGDTVRMSTPQVIRTPVTSLASRSREQSSSSQPARSSTSGKRTISEVIDLTSSGDEAEQPVAPPPKRPNTNINGYAPIPSIPTGPAAYRHPPHPSLFYPQ